jgi:molybdopterin/thiamine biosynthesis adenylyltransferase
VAEKKGFAMNNSKFMEFFDAKTLLRESRVTIVGAGSVGSAVAYALARTGVTRFEIFDDDIVEDKNIANQMYTRLDVGKPKVEALSGILSDINDEIADESRFRNERWSGQRFSGGHVFLCVDTIETRRDICEVLKKNPYVRSVSDFRTGLTDGQYRFATLSNNDECKALVESMDFTHEEAMAETPVSACGVTLGVFGTVQMLAALGTSNFINYLKGNEYKKLILCDTFTANLIAIN